MLVRSFNYQDVLQMLETTCKLTKALCIEHFGQHDYSRPAAGRLERPYSSSYHQLRPPRVPGTFFLIADCSLCL